MALSAQNTTKKDVLENSQTTNRPLAAIYVRVSTEDQAQHGFSLAGQEDSLKNYAKALGYEILGIYRDEGISAKDLKKRPAMQKLLGDAEKKKFSAIFVYKLDRFSRSLKDLVLTIDKLKDLGIDFISLQDKIETASASGKLMFHIISAFAEFERNIIGERTTFGMARKNKEGGAVSKPPFGYKMVEKELVVDLERAPLVTEMFSNYLSGVSLNKLAKKYGFSVNGVKKMLSNRTYLGEVKFAGESSKGLHKPLVAEDLFYGVQGILGGNFRRFSNVIRAYEAEVIRWIKNNYRLLGYDKILQENDRKCPDFVMLKGCNKIRVEVELYSRGFLKHKHDPSSVDEVLCVKKDVDLSIPVSEIKQLAFWYDLKPDELVNFFKACPDTVLVNHKTGKQIHHFQDDWLKLSVEREKTIRENLRKETNYLQNFRF